MTLIESFLTTSEQKLNEEFLKQGYVIRDVDVPHSLNYIRNNIVSLACNYLGIENNKDDDQYFLDNIQKNVPVANLNSFRLALYNQMNAMPWFRPTYFALGKSIIETLVGNELAMQNRVNLSIQLPQDDSSLIGIHSDAFSGETPFQVVQWLPLVNTEETKSMFILPPEQNRVFVPKLKEIMQQGGRDGLLEAVRPHLIWLKVNYGQVVVFSPNLLHGNVINQTSETRWSFNCRFTGLFTPYTSPEKSLGGFYLPITTRAVSRIGMSYKHPGGFDE